MNRIILLGTLLLAFHFSFTQTPYFPPLTGDQWETLSPESQGWDTSYLDSLQQFLDEKNTKAFLILVDGKIVVEWYFDTFTQDSAWYWASAGKTLTATLTGIAQEEGLLSISDTSSTYLGEGWTSLTPEQEEKITIWHQLTMTSGMNGLFFDCLEPDCLQYVADAGTRWAYHNSPYTLLREVLEEASGVDLNVYIRDKLLLPTGMTGLWFRSAQGNLFFSKARSMARFGWLMLNEGIWNGDTVLGDTSYLRQMITPSQDLNKSYGYLWWLNGKESHMLPAWPFVIEGPASPKAPMDMYSALGKNGQFLNVIPSMNMVVLRMGESPDDALVPASFLDEMWGEISNVIAGTATPRKGTIFTKDIQVFPNPANSYLKVSLGSQPISHIRLYDLQGKLLVTTSKTYLSVTGLPKGVYLLEVENTSGELGYRRFVK